MGLEDSDKYSAGKNINITDKILIPVPGIYISGYGKTTFFR